MKEVNEGERALMNPSTAVNCRPHQTSPNPPNPPTHTHFRSGWFASEHWTRILVFFGVTAYSTIKVISNQTVMEGAAQGDG